jgi:hypothetical protein
MQRLEIELVDRLQGDKTHGGALVRFRNRLGVEVVVLLRLHKWADVLRRHQPHVVAMRHARAADVVSPAAGLPTRHGGSVAMNRISCGRENRRRNTTVPAPSNPTA